VGDWKMGVGVSQFNTLQQTKSPQKGDVGYIHEPYRHHCIITEVNGDTVKSIDGNSGTKSEVIERTRPITKYTGFFTAFTGSEKYIQKKEDAANSESGSTGLQDKLSAKSGKGSPMDETTRSQMESGFGADFSGVNIHTDSQAVEMNKGLNALAFTHGNDIYFNEGKYNPETTSGKHLLAHELTHTVQQGASKPSIQKNGDDFDDHKSELQKFQISLDDADFDTLTNTYSNGISVTALPLNVRVQGANYLSGIKLKGFQVHPIPPLLPSVQTYIFPVGKARSILVTSHGQGGGSVMLDTGTQNIMMTGKLMQALRQIFVGKLAKPPQLLQISHTDNDHWKAVKDFLALPELDKITIEIAKQQIENSKGRKDWRKMNIQLRPDQKIIRLDISGQNVHEQKRIIGSMEVTDYRSVAAHNPADPKKFNKNESVPVTVIRDLVTGTTQIFTSDQSGKTLGEMVNNIGPNAFRRIMGGGGRNLKLMEISHHGGKVGPGDHTAGMLRFLRLSFEASKGDIRFFTQTSDSFSKNPSSIIKTLNSVGIETAKVTTGGSGSQSEVIRGQGGTLSTMTMDTGRIQSVVEIGRKHETRLLESYATRHKLLEVHESSTLLQTMLQSDKSEEIKKIRSSLDTVKSDSKTSENNLNKVLDRYWGKLLSASQKEGIRSTTKTPGIKAELANLKNAVKVSEIEKLQNSYKVTVNGLNAYDKVFLNLAEMFRALDTGNYQKLLETKAKQRAFLKEARNILGKAEVHKVMKTTWEEIRQRWTDRTIKKATERIGKIATYRRLKADFRAESTFKLINMARQKQLNALMEAAQHGQLSRGVRAPVRTRVGAGILAGIEVARILMEGAVMIKESNEAEERRKVYDKIEGMNSVSWWMRMGATPIMKLVKKSSWSGYNTVSGGLSNNDIHKILTDSYTGEAPDYDKVVVDNINPEDLEFIVGRLTVEIDTYQEWVSKIGHPESNTGWFKKDDGVWKVALWDGDNAYRYYQKSIIQQPLNDLMLALEKNQQEEFNKEMAELEPGEVKAVDDSAIVGTDRNLYIYNSAGRLREIDIESFSPKIQVVGTEYVGELRKEMKLVKAINLKTYKVLSKYYWMRLGQENISQQGTYRDRIIFKNADGLAYVDPDDVVLTVGSVATQNAAIVSQSQTQVQKKSQSPALTKNSTSTSPGETNSKASLNISRELHENAGKGRALPEHLKEEMNEAFVHDFDEVRIHTDDTAVAMNKVLHAKAFTHGNDIYFNQGKYDTSSTDGKHLLAHELTHTIQQGSGEKQIQRRIIGENVTMNTLEGSPARVEIYGPYTDAAISEELYGDPTFPINHDPQDFFVVYVNYSRLRDIWKSAFNLESNQNESEDNSNQELEPVNGPSVGDRPEIGEFPIVINMPGGETLRLSENEEHTRYALKSLVAREGRGIMDSVIRRLSTGLRNFGRPHVPSYEAPWNPLPPRRALSAEDQFRLTKGQEILETTTRVVRDLNQEFDNFINEFGERIEPNALAILNANEERTRSEMIRYGITWRDETDAPYVPFVESTSYSMGENLPSAEGLKNAAQILLR
ncbi:MAG: DUF4157 domain-containing protein, partial [Bacteroidota bacterium]